MSQHRKENVSVSKGSGVSRGDKRRNARLAELRRLVPRENAIAGIDLADQELHVVLLVVREPLSGPFPWWSEPLPPS
jgi:transposase